MSQIKFSPLIKLWVLFSLKDPLEIDISEDSKKEDNVSHYHDPILRLCKNLNTIQIVVPIKNLTKLLYFNRIKVHEILYENQNFINIKSNSKNIDYCFYLTLLIKSQANIINYIYSFNYINNLFELVKEEDKDKINLKKIIISKMVCEIIKNYQESEEYKEIEKEKINEMLKKCEDNINNNLKDLKILGLEIDANEIKSKRIDEIYILIIICLIKRKKLENYDYANNIIEQLDFESINLTNIMFKELLNFFNENENYIKKYEIYKVDDLSDFKKIYFYYFLFQYILKNSIYIYQIPFLLKIRKNILSFIKNASNIPSLKNIDNFGKNKIEYILKTFLDSTYYIKYIDKIVYNKDYKDLNSFKYNFSYSNSFSNSISLEIIDEDENKDPNSISKKEIENEIWFKILKDSFFKIEIKKTRSQFIYKYENISYKNKNIYKEIKYEDFLEIKENKINSKYFDEYLKFFDFLKSIENKLINLKENSHFKLNIILKFNSNKNKNDIFNLEGRYKYNLLNQKYNSTNEFTDININKDKNGFNLFFEEIKKKIEIGGSSYNEYNEFSIIEFDDIIGQHEESSEFIKELSNGLYISGSIDHTLIIYNKFHKNNKNRIIELKVQHSNLSADSICEINPNQKDEKNIQIFICSKSHLFLYTLNNKTEKFTTIVNKKFKKLYFNQCIEIKNKNYIFIGGKGAFLVIGEPLKIIKGDNNKDINISAISRGKYYSSGIKINENIVAISSNSIISKGEDKLIFYNLEQMQITHEIEGFSFIISLNGLSLMTIKNEKNDNKILLCACRKYKSNQKNGILLVEPELKENEEVYHEFYETEYEVHCFCKINDVIVENINDNIYNKTIKETNFFLVGGFDNEKREGKIYLYELIYDREKSHSKIELISEIGYKNYDKLYSINCIIQSKKTGNILISCSDGKVYSFKFNGEYLLKILN